MNNILVIGDSWASAVVAGDPAHGGWPQILGIPAELRQAVPGSTAAQWANDFEGRLTRSYATPADVAIVALSGNDAINAMADGVLSPKELIDLLTFTCGVLTGARGEGEPQRPVYMLGYADPFCGRDPRMSIGVTVLNSALEALFIANDTVPGGFIRTADILGPDCFDGLDIHPNLKGHEAIAQRIAEVIK